MKSMIALVILITMLQPIVSAQSLQPGDRMPSIEFRETYPGNRIITAAGLRGKAVIFDFWHRTCMACIRAFPKIDSLQQVFGEQLQIFLVTRESPASIDSFFRKYTRIKKPRVIFISGDTVLHQLFPHIGVPYHVWVDSSGIVQYTTGGENTTQENVESFIKREFFYAMNIGNQKIIHSLFDSAFNADLEFYSYLSRCNKGYKLISNTRAGYTDITKNCTTIPRLYKAAWAGTNIQSLDRPGMILLEVTDSSMLIPPKNTSLRARWTEQNTYSYQLSLPLSRASEKYQHFQEDLERHFPYTGQLMERKVPCLALIRTSNFNKLKSKGGSVVAQFYQLEEKSTVNDSLRRVQNYPYEKLSGKLASYVERNFDKPFVDRTGLTGAVDMVIPGGVMDGANLVDLNKALESYDLKIVDETVTLTVLVIRDKTK